MPTRETAPTGAPCWVDLMTSDPATSREFYTRLFGWTAEEPNEEFGGYFNFQRDGARVAGCMASRPDAGMPDVWSVYLASDDASKTVEAARANGGQVYVEPMAVADLGTMAFLGDVGGAGVGLWQPGTHPGFRVFGEPGTPSWFELYTRDYEASLRFYREVFQWGTKVANDTEEFRYTLMVSGNEELAGVFDASSALPGDAPAGWFVYFGTADTDATLARAVELGGSIIDPAQDTPYGRLATAADPTGARFKLVAGNESMRSGSSG